MATGREQAPILVKLLLSKGYDVIVEMFLKGQYTHNRRFRGL